MDDKFSNYMEGMAAAGKLLSRAHENGSFVESVCLSASLIDGLLRMGLILQHQIETESLEIIPELLFQGAKDKIVSERSVYERAELEGIIDARIRTQLDSLYSERNKVVHRYIISGIKTADVLDIAHQYHMILMAVNNLVAEIEKKQIRLGVGMTRNYSHGVVRTIEEMAERKHGDSVLAENLKRDL